MKNLLYRLIAVLLGFSLAFGLAEITVRVLCPQEVGPLRFAFDQNFGRHTGTRAKGPAEFTRGLRLHVQQ